MSLPPRAPCVQVSLAKKMATYEGARALLEDMRARTHGAAKKEHAELEKYAGQPLMHWDVAYWAERLKKERYSFDEEVR